MPLESSGKDFFQKPDTESSKEKTDEIALSKLASLYVTEKDRVHLAKTRDRKKFIYDKGINFTSESRKLLMGIDADNERDFFNKASALLGVKNLFDELENK